MSDEGHVNSAYEMFPEKGQDISPAKVKVILPEEEMPADYCYSVTEDGESDDEDDTESNEDGAYHSKIPAHQLSAKAIESKRRFTKRASRRAPYTWDVFRETSKDNLTSSEIELWNKVFKVTKVIFSIILFIFVLGTSVLSKSTLFLIIANIIPPSQLQNSSLKTANNHFRYVTSDTAITWIWSLVLVVIAPYFLTVFFSVWRLIFKKTRPMEWKPLIMAILVETIHSVGLNIFIFALLPTVDPFTGMFLCMNVAVIPSFLGLFYSGSVTPQSESSVKLIIRRVTRSIALVAAVTSLAMWCVYVYRLDTDGIENSPGLIVLFVLSPILLSVSWWENFVPQGDEYSRGLRKFKRQLRSRRTKISALVNLWKIVMTIGTVTIIYGIDCEDGVGCLETLYNIRSNATLWSATFGHTNLVRENYIGTCTRYLPLLLAAVNIASSIVCYRCCVSAIKIVSQVISFSIPTVLTTPLSAALMLGVYTFQASILVYQYILSQKAKHKEASKYDHGMPQSQQCRQTTSTKKKNHRRITFTRHQENKQREVMKDVKLTDGCSLPYPRWEGTIEFDWSMIVASILGYIAIVFLTNYIWSPSKERLQREDRMFVQPLYCGVLFDQCMLLNRRKDDTEDMKGVDEKEKLTELPIPENLETWSPGDEWSPLRHDDTPFIYLCATMWHETENEMTQILKSLFRMDEDQCARRNLQLFFGIEDPDYYEFEGDNLTVFLLVLWIAHIFFDDAFEYHGKEGKANGYVKQLIRTIDVAISSVHTHGMKIPPPSKIDTPYGGRLIWKLPGGNKMIAHLKDKSKIRHRKRWSQVMYMYYFLAHKLLALGGGKDKIKTISDNTFLLALDGDVDFQPSALRLLVDRMKRNPQVGAACGRIHPIGSGPMVWYQKFEYAVSHWLQKATEHTIGCVLCSPGCFSLFRGSSLMDNNVMRRYTTPPTEARHYVQYDQGEDRWLCTLLLQQGYRVEYCAASDALTYAPEGFYEFYNQRRRWTPSTMANILDLLMDWKNVTTKNNDISMLYISYHMLLMVSSILTPGTIFLLILGAISLAYPDLPLFGSLLLNLFPVALFIIMTYIAKGNHQLAYAAILSTIYSLVMMLVLVGLLRQAFENGFCSVTTVFLCFVAGVFVVSAFLHPQEFWCIIHGFLYFLAIPSMSMLLMLYSLGNLHIVSWGTREAPKRAVAAKPGENKAPAKKGAVHEWLEKLGLVDSVGSSDYMFSFGNLFRCICCPQETKHSEDIKLRAILDRLDDMEAKLMDTSQSHVTGVDLPSEQENDYVAFSETSELFEGARDRDNPLFKEEKKKTMPWIRDADLLGGTTEILKQEEVKFWKELIDTYLFPLEGDKKQQEKIQDELVELRNKVCLFFLLINALFVTIVFTLQQVSATSSTMSIDLPCANGNYGEAIEPISIAFTLVFGILLLIQFICMIFHRMATFLHILALTEVKIRKPKQFKDKEEQISVQKGLELVMDMQSAKDDDTKSVASLEDEVFVDDDDKTARMSRMDKRKDELARRMTGKRRPKKHGGTLSQNFVKNFKKLQQYIEDDEQGVVNNTLRVPKVSFTEPEPDYDEDIQRIQTVKSRFNRLERKSIFTIAKITKDQRLKKSILHRGSVVANRWKKTALLARLKNAAQVAASSEQGDKTDGRPTSKVTMVDIARLAMADRNSNVPSEDEDDSAKL